MTTAIVWDERYLLHKTGPCHPESPDRLMAIREMLDDFPKDRLVFKMPRPATFEEITLAHTEDHIREIERTAGRDVQLDPDTHASPKSYEAARLAVGGVLECVDSVMKDGAQNAFAFVRPPGHHAEKDRAMGFCLFNNIAIAAEYALKKYNLRRIFIMDFDVHHGNGTQNAFYSRGEVFYCSTHRYPFYPGTGSEREEGRGEGKGTTRNITFRGGEGDLEYDTAFAKIVLPVARDFSPDLVLVSAGYDAHESDPLGGMNVSSAGFGHMMKGLLGVASETCRGRLVAVLEGGYDLSGLRQGIRCSLQEMVAQEMAVAP